jgi:hypothetical protein
MAPWTAEPTRRLPGTAPIDPDDRLPRHRQREGLEAPRSGALGAVSA